MFLECAFERIWHSLYQPNNSSPTERQFLRSIHHDPNLTFWVRHLNRDLLHKKLSPVFATSIWVDHTPQCRFSNTSGTTTSCELADLLIVLWDNIPFGSGKALLVQAKRGKSHNRILTSNASTQNELDLLGNAPSFFLTSQTNVPPGSTPTPFHSKKNCNFQLPHYAKKRLKHCTFLQIKHAMAQRWPYGSPSWQTMWPQTTKRQSLYQESYGKVIFDMVSNSSKSMGKPFIYNNKNQKKDWDRLVTILIDQTIATSGGTAQGPKQHTALYHPKTHHNKRSGGGNDIPHSDNPQGISTIFITPEHDE